jgi:hypothetical protein
MEDSDLKHSCLYHRAPDPNRSSLEALEPPCGLGPAGSPQCGPTSAHTSVTTLLLQVPACLGPWHQVGQVWEWLPSPMVEMLVDAWAGQGRVSPTSFLPVLRTTR